MKKPLALVIEDEYDAAVIMREALEAANFEVIVIHDGEIAQKQIAIQNPALIALDLHLPNVSGDMLLQQIRADERLANTHVMLVTADDRMAQSVEKQANYLLLKPISFSQLRRLAQRLNPNNDES